MVKSKMPSEQEPADAERQHQSRTGSAEKLRADRAGRLKKLEDREESIRRGAAAGRLLVRRRRTWPAERRPQRGLGPAHSLRRPFRDQVLVGARQAAQLSHGLRSRLVLRAPALGEAFRPACDLGQQITAPGGKLTEFSRPAAIWSSVAAPQRAFRWAILQSRAPSIRSELGPGRERITLPGSNTNTINASELG